MCIRDRVHSGFQPDQCAAHAIGRDQTQRRGIRAAGIFSRRPGGDAGRVGARAGVAGVRPTGGRGDGCRADGSFSEVLALRTILINIIYDQANGHEIAPERMRELIAKADAGKVEKALERLKENSSATENGR